MLTERQNRNEPTRPEALASGGVVVRVHEASPGAEREALKHVVVVLQRQANLSEEEAYKRLQQQSMKTRRSMREIAEAVILSSELS